MSEFTQNGEENQEVPGWSNHIVYALSLSEPEMALRKKFVDEYLVDYNKNAAALRCGFSPMASQEYATRLWNDSYVQHLIALRTYKKQNDPNDEGAEEREKQQTRQQIIEALKREAFYKGPGSSQAARVAALSKLAAMFGLDKGALTGEDNDLPKGGVMVVPMMMSAEQWENTAKAAQAQLAQDTNNDISSS